MRSIFTGRDEDCYQYFNDKLLVGEGDFGSVYKGSIDDCTRIVAIKWLKFKP